jgi:hypothetical protein
VTEGPAPGHLRPTSAGPLAVFTVLGLVGGWLIRPFYESQGWSALVVTWSQVGVLYFVAGIVAVVAWSTWRTLQVRQAWIEPHRAVNRLLMAKSSALVGVLVAGGYAGFAVSWLGVQSELADQRITRSLLAMLAGLLITTGALWLERACRVTGEDEEP